MVSRYDYIILDVPSVMRRQAGGEFQLIFDIDGIIQKYHHFWGHHRLLGPIVISV
jgi:hypothetical protein